jgi:hypothetical protein
MICNLVAITPEKLRNLRRDPTGLLDMILADGGPTAARRLDLDKSWHGLHYLLTGTAWDGAPPFSLAILGGAEIGEDTGYGPPRYLTPEEVRAVAGALHRTPHESFLARFDPAAMNAAEIYSGGWENCAAQAMRQQLGHLAEFYASAAADGMAVLICLS